MTPQPFLHMYQQDANELYFLNTDHIKSSIKINHNEVNECDYGKLCYKQSSISLEPNNLINVHGTHIKALT